MSNFKVGDKVRMNGHRNDDDEHEYGTNETMERWERDGAALTVQEVNGIDIEAGDGRRSFSFHPSELTLVDEDQITLQPGDYVSTEGMTEEQYHAVARAFMASGADGSKGDYGHRKYEYRQGGETLGWDARDDELWEMRCRSVGFTGRHLTIDQVLGATNATPQETTMTTMTTNPITTLKQARQARDDAEKAYQEALGEAREYLGEGFELTEVGTDGPLVDGEDMTDPANWREGDVVECINDEPKHCHVGGLYIVNRGAECQSLSIKADDDGDLGVPPLSSFRFHHRPA